MTKIQKNVSLKNYTTFKIGGPAKYFFIAKSKQDLIEAVKYARNRGLPFFILGGGSNLLVADEGYDGMVIKIQDLRLKIRDEKIQAGAGTKLEELVKASTRAGLTGLEWAAGIPGTIGGVVYGNAGAFGKSMADIVKNVEILKITRVGPVQIKKFENKDCKFAYRDSIFKKNKNLIVLSCFLQLKKGNKQEIRQRIKKFLKERKETQPLEFPSTGSVFKNPLGKKAAELVDRCGLRGKRIGGAMVSTKHANFIVNLGKARSEDVIQLINLIKNKVKNKFGIELKEEVQIIHS